MNQSNAELSGDDQYVCSSLCTETTHGVTNSYLDAESENLRSGFIDQVLFTVDQLMVVTSSDNV